MSWITKICGESQSRHNPEQRGEQSSKRSRWNREEGMGQHGGQRRVVRLFHVTLPYILGWSSMAD